VPGPGSGPAVVIGIGNEFRRDDGTGPAVIGQLRGRVPDPSANSAWASAFATFGYVTQDPTQPASVGPIAERQVTYVTSPPRPAAGACKQSQVGHPQ